MTVHPLAELFPLMEGAAFDEFCEDIRTRGQIEPITVLGNMILDGRNRQRACDRLQRPVKRQPFDSLGLKITPEEFIWSRNVQRRHLTDDQRAAIAMQWRPQFLAEGRKAMKDGGRSAGVSRPRKGMENSPHPISPAESKNGKTRTKLAALAGVAPGRIKSAEEIRHEPGLLAEVASGKASLRQAIRKAENSAEPTKRKVMVENAAKKRMISVLSEVRGMCRGLADINIPALCEVCTDEEKETWARTAREAALKLRKFAASLEGRENGNGEAQTQAQDG